MYGQEQQSFIDPFCMLLAAEKKILVDWLQKDIEDALELITRT